METGTLGERPPAMNCASEHQHHHLFADAATQHMHITYMHNTCCPRRICCCHNAACSYVHLSHFSAFCCHTFAKRRDARFLSISHPPTHVLSLYLPQSAHSQTTTAMHTRRLRSSRLLRHLGPPSRYVPSKPVPILQGRRRQGRRRAGDRPPASGVQCVWRLLDCLESSAHAAPSDADSFLHVYSFEPSQYNHALSLLALDHFFPSNGQAASRGQWHITRAAVGACLHLDACCVIVGVAHDHSLVAFSSHAMFYCPVRQ